MCQNMCLRLPLQVRAGRGIFLCLQSDFFTTTLISSLCSGAHLHLWMHYHGVIRNLARLMCGVLQTRVQDIKVNHAAIGQSAEG